MKTKTNQITRYTYLVVWQYSTEGHAAGDVVSMHTSLIDAVLAACQHWAHAVIQV